MKDCKPLRSPPLQWLQRRYGGEGSRDAMVAERDGRAGSVGSLGSNPDSPAAFLVEIWIRRIRSCGTSGMVWVILCFWRLISVMPDSLRVSVPSTDTLPAEKRLSNLLEFKGLDRGHACSMCDLLHISLHFALVWAFLLKIQFFKIFFQSHIF